VHDRHGGHAMTSTIQRRSSERHNVTINVNVEIFVDGKYATFAGQASDISKGGLRLFLTRELEPGTAVKMEFVLPYNSAECTIRGVVRNKSGFMHGVEFINTTAFQEQMIERTCHVFSLLR